MGALLGRCGSSMGGVGGPGLEKGEGRVWGHQDMRCGGRKADKKESTNGEGGKGTCWAPAPGVGG